MAEDFASWSVVELCRGYGPATVAGKLLADLGCAVVKVEDPEGDPLRDDPAARGGGLSVFELLCASKDSVCIDLDHVGADEPLAALLSGTEIVLLDGEAWRALQDRLGNPDRIRDRFPRLTIAVSTHLGMAGPLAGWQANEEILQAMSGVMSTTGHAGRPAARIPGGMLTEATAMFAVIASIGDVMRKRRGGAASLLDCNGLAAATAFMTTALPAYFLSGTASTGIGNRHAMAAPWNTFPCSDGWLVLCAGNEPSWRRLCVTIGRPELVDDPRFATAGDRVANVEALEAEIEAWTVRHTVEEAERLLEVNTIPSGAILSLDQVLAHPQFAARSLLRTDAGATLAGAVFHRNRAAPAVRARTWRLGAATREVLTRRFGVRQIDCERWQAAGIVGAGLRGAA